MAESKTIRVVVARVLQRNGDEGQWHPVGYLDSIEEADAVLNQLLEAEREALHHEGNLGEREYDVWLVPNAWSVIEPSEV